jgi:glutamate transport system substrate-binding protein
MLRQWFRRGTNLRLLALVLVMILVVGVAVAVFQHRKNPTIDDLRSQAGWDDLQTLQVGVSGDVPGLSDCIDGGTRCTGFDVEIANLVRDRLKDMGVPIRQIHFSEVLPEDRERMKGWDFATGQKVDLNLVVAGFSMTDERITKDKVVFAGPYLTTETTVLNRIDSGKVDSLRALNTPIKGADGKLRPQRVCSSGATTSIDYLQAAAPDADLRSPLRNSECVADLLANKVDAVVTDAAILAGFQQQNSTVLQLNNIPSTSDEQWGIGLGKQTDVDPKILHARQQLVLLALQDLQSGTNDDNWERAFNVLPQTPPATEANSDVQVVAEDHQPPLRGLEPVRRWWWERTGIGSGR